MATVSTLSSRGSSFLVFVGSVVIVRPLRDHAVARVRFANQSCLLAFRHVLVSMPYVFRHDRDVMFA